MGEGTVSDFSAFFALAEPRLRRAFVSAYGGERGREATAEALAWAWEHWSEVEAMDNPIGYLYRVGRSRTRGRRYRVLFDREPTAVTSGSSPASATRWRHSPNANGSRSGSCTATGGRREVPTCAGSGSRRCRTISSAAPRRLRALLGVSEDV